MHGYVQLRIRASQPSGVTRSQTFSERFQPSHKMLKLKESLHTTTVLVNAGCNLFSLTLFWSDKEG